MFPEFTSEKQNRFETMVDWVNVFFVTFVLVCVLLVGSHFVVQDYATFQTYTGGAGMFPSIDPGDTLLVDKWVYVFHQPHRGDIILIQAVSEPTAIPGNSKVVISPSVVTYPSKAYVERVIAVAGDSVTVTGNGYVVLNGFPLAEPYAAFYGSSVPGETLTVPPGYVYVLEDDRDWGYDSRQFGLVPLANVIGRVEDAHRPFYEDTDFVPDLFSLFD